MVAPLIIYAGVVAVTAAMQYYNSEKSRGATAKRLKEIEAMFDAIVPPDLDIKVWDNPALVATVPPSSFRLDQITPEQYESVGQYIPQVAEFVKENKPEMVQASSTAKEGRQAQLDALRKYKDVAAGGFDPELQQSLNESSARSGREAQSRSASILQDANRRGMAGSGIALGAQLRAGSDSMAQNSLDSMRAAAEGYRNKLNSLDRSASLGGDIRSSEMSEEARNVGIINDFNQRTNRNYQEWNNNRANFANTAQQKNLDVKQRIADANVANRNKSTVDERDYYNNVQSQMYQQNRNTRSDRMDVEDRKNRLKQQMYDNLLAKSSLKAGVGYKATDYLQANTRDKNQAIQGLGESVAVGASAYGQDKKPVKPQYQDADYDEDKDTDLWRTA